MSLQAEPAAQQSVEPVGSENDVVLSALETGCLDPLPTAADEQVSAVPCSPHSPYSFLALLARYQTWLEADRVRLCERAV